MSTEVYNDAVITLETPESVINGKVNKLEVKWQFPELLFSPVNDFSTVHSLMNTVNGEAELQLLELSTSGFSDLYVMDSTTPMSLAVEKGGKTIAYITWLYKQSESKSSQGLDQVYTIPSGEESAAIQRKVLVPSLTFIIFRIL